MNPPKKVIEARRLPVLPTHSHCRSAPLPVLFLAFGSGLHSAAFSPAAWSGSSLGGKVRRGGSSAAAVAEGGHYSDDPSRDERPPNYDPNGEQLDVASQHEPGIIAVRGSVPINTHTRIPRKRRTVPRTLLRICLRCPGVKEVQLSAISWFGRDAGVAVHRRDNVSQWPFASQNRRAFLLNQPIGNCNGLAELGAEGVRTRVPSA
jgi:hypothetical protein